MPRYAIVENGLIKNIIVVKEGTKTTASRIDVSSVICAIGDPVVDKTPVPRPSKYHTVNAAGTGWELTAEAEELKVQEEAEFSRTAGITAERESSGLREITVEQAYSYIDGKIEGASDLDELKTAVATVLKKIAVFILK